MNKIIVLVISLLHTALLLLLKFFPYPEIFVYPYLYEHGLIPYKQIFDQHFPSVLMMPVNLFEMGVRSEMSAKLVLIVIVLTAHLLIFLISRKLFKNGRLIYLPNLFYLLIQPLFEGNYLWIDTFLVPILLLLFYFSLLTLESKSYKKAFIAGLFLGISVFVKQTMMPLAIMVAVFLSWKTKSFKISTYILMGGIIPLIVLFAWICEKGIVSQFIYWTMLFNFTIYPDMAAKMPTLSQIVRTFILFFPPIIFFTKNLRNNRFMLLLIFILLTTVSALTRFEFVHLQPSLAFLCFGIFIFITKSKYGKIYLTLCAMLLLIWWPVFIYKNFAKSSSLFTPDAIITSKEIKFLTKNEDKIYVLGSQPIIYPLSDRLPAGNVFSVNLPWNTKIVEEKILYALVNDPPKVIVRDENASIDGLKVVDFTSNVNEFINERYKITKKIGNNEILIQK